MNSLRSLVCTAVALALVPSLAWAEESLAQWAQRRVDEGIVRPLAEKSAQRSKFSRAARAPIERRARITRTSPLVDKRGREFLPFAIDVRFGSDWREDQTLGCVYRHSGELFVKNADEYRPAAYLLGKNVGPVAGVCEAAPPRS